MPEERRPPNSLLRSVRERDLHMSREEFARAIEARTRDAGESAICDARAVKRWENGTTMRPRGVYRRAIVALTGRTEDDLGWAEKGESGLGAAVTLPGGLDDEVDALELARRVAASDVGKGTLDRLWLAVDDLAVAYPGTPPAELLGRVRRYLRYVMQLVEARKTLTDHRRLLVIGGWFSLLGATLHIDLHQWPAASARLRTAAQLADHAEHRELAAWCLETQAWQVLTDGDYRRAVVLAQGAQRVAPRASSAFIQATAQEGRAWARLGERAATLDALARVDRLVAPLPMPDRPEHHYRYDPSKSEAYVATTLSWLGDPAAEGHARQVLERLESTEGGPPRPRRAASARLDLSLALLASNKPDEASAVALAAVMSGRLVPSNFWRAHEVVAAVESRGVREAAELRDAYETLCPADGINGGIE
jgi:hypothetical protein